MLSTVELRQIDGGIIATAGKLEPAGLRSLDAIHLATALELADELDELVAYDRAPPRCRRALRNPNGISLGP